MAFFNRPIMGRTQILVHRWGPRHGFWHCFADRLTQTLVLSVALASCGEDLLKTGYYNYG